MNPLKKKLEIWRNLFEQDDKTLVHFFFSYDIVRLTSKSSKIIFVCIKWVVQAVREELV
jgi:hypothetical protein